MSILLTINWSYALPVWRGSAHRQHPRCHPRGRFPELSHQHVSFLASGPPICVCSSVKRTRCQNKFTTDFSQRPDREGRRNEKITERAGAGLEKRRGGSARAKGSEKENETGRGGIPELPKAVGGERIEGRKERV
ncbi:uncharacterized [Tachysurus ichikawai]